LPLLNLLGWRFFHHHQVVWQTLQQEATS
jgi:hypothetical protein